MTFIQRRFKQFSRFQREGIGSLQLRLTLGITAVSLLGLGSIGTWTIWDMRQMLLVKHKQSLELVADRFPEGLDLLREWQIRGFKLLETRAKNRFTQEV